MEKSEITFGLIALLALMQPDANAAAKRMDADGCTLLANTVESAVLRAAGQSDIQTILQVGGDLLHSSGLDTKGPTSCNETTRVTTAAFSAALFKIGMPVGWGDAPPNPGDFCYSHYLDQCYPRLVSGYSASSAKQLSFVNDTWKAVNVGVRNFMPYGTAGDFSRFTPGVLKLSMIGAVASNVDTYSKSTASPHKQRHDDL